MILSAAAKTIHSATAAKALTELGLAERFARPATRLGTVAEAVVAIALIMWPRSTVVQMACWSLFAAFAVMGGLAVRRGGAIDCGCLGHLEGSRLAWGSRLGWWQVIQFLLVGLSMLIVARFVPSWESEAALVGLVFLQVLLSVVLIVRLAPSWRLLRCHRISLAASRRFAREVGLGTEPPQIAGASD